MSNLSLYLFFSSVFSSCTNSSVELGMLTPSMADVQLFYEIATHTGHLYAGYWDPTRSVDLLIARCPFMGLCKNTDTNLTEECLNQDCKELGQHIHVSSTLTQCLFYDIWFGAARWTYPVSHHSFSSQIHPAWVSFPWALEILSSFWQSQVNHFPSSLDLSKAKIVLYSWASP